MWHFLRTAKSFFAGFKWYTSLNFVLRRNLLWSFVRSFGEVLKLLLPIVVEGSPAYKSWRTRRNANILIQFLHHLIKLIFSGLFEMVLFNLICDEPPVLIIHIICFCGMFVSLIQMRSFNAIEFEIFSLENIAVFNLLVIKFIDILNVLFFCFFLGGSYLLLLLTFYLDNEQ